MLQLPLSGAISELFYSSTPKNCTMFCIVQNLFLICSVFNSSVRVLFCVLVAATSFLLVSLSTAYWISILGKRQHFLMHTLIINFNFYFQPLSQLVVKVTQIKLRLEMLCLGFISCHVIWRTAAAPQKPDAISVLSQAAVGHIYHQALSFDQHMLKKKVQINVVPLCWLLHAL